MPTHNALATWAIIDQLTSLLPKDSEEVNLQVKWLHAMLDAATMMDPALNPEAGRRGQDPEHRQSPHGDSAISFSHSPDERGQGHAQGMLRTSSTVGTLAIGSRTVIETMIVLRVSAVTSGTMTPMALTMTSPPDGALLREAEMKEESMFCVTI
jgi:hypothetical protein